MSKITNDGLAQSGIGCFIAVPMATVGVKGLNLNIILCSCTVSVIVRIECTKTSTKLSESQHKCVNKV